MRSLTVQVLVVYLCTLACCSEQVAVSYSSVNANAAILKGVTISSAVPFEALKDVSYMMSRERLRVPSSNLNPFTDTAFVQSYINELKRLEKNWPTAKGAPKRINLRPAPSSFPRSILSSPRWACTTKGRFASKHDSASTISCNWRSIRRSGTTREPSKTSSLAWSVGSQKQEELPDVVRIRSSLPKSRMPFRRLGYGRFVPHANEATADSTAWE